MPGQRTPSSDAVNLHVRRQLAAAIADWIITNDWTQAEAAAKLGVSEPRISHLASGQMERFSVDALLNMAAKAGLHIELTVTSAATASKGVRP